LRKNYARKTLEAFSSKLRDGPGRAERRAIRRGEGDHAAYARVVMAQGLERLTGGSNQKPDKHY
jgi:hypothetical protein